MELAELNSLGLNGWSLQLFLVLLMVASFVGVVVKKIRLPYSIALVIAGLVIGVFQILPPVEMTPEMVLLLMLPALLFEASWNIKFSELKENLFPITVLATIGVIVSTLAVAGLVYLFSGLGLAAALIFGAMISATDPISVLALFKKLGINKRLTMILEGESLFNDGTAVVLFKLILVTAMTGASFSIHTAVGSFVTSVVGGIALGAGLGYLASRCASYFDDHLLETMLTTILAYGSYLLAEAFHVSPVIATVCAGIVMGNYGSRIGMTANTRQAVNQFWEYAAFVVNSLVFLLIGLQMNFGLFQKYGLLIGICIIATLAARALVVYGLSPLIGGFGNKIPMSWQHVLTWGALRGSLCMALALSLPNEFPHREALIVVTFAVVLFTLLVKGLTIEWLVGRLNIEKVTPSEKTDK